MNKSSSKLFLAALALVALAAFTVTSTAEAARQGGGGGGGGGGGDRASAGGGGGGGGGANRAAPAAQNKNVQASNVNADKRTNNVRNTSANNVNVNNNNVNVNKNVNVNVDNNGGCCNNGWDNDYHPLATAAQLRAGELRRHGLPAVRYYLVPVAGTSVRRRQSALLKAPTSERGRSRSAGRRNRPARRPGYRPGISGPPQS